MALCVPRFIDSPHQDARPLGLAVDLLVLHAISLPDGEFSMQHVEALFCGVLDVQAHPSFANLADLRVSAHFVVDRQGLIHQFVPLARQAWHAGLSCWQGIERCNDYSVGIEILGDERMPFTDAQYRETARLCRALMVRFPAINTSRIVGHSDIAAGRKWDPGRQWDWAHFRRSLAHIRNVEMHIR
ncbi:MAG: 1,6-anhydro-N-acetylmuramyl-L-alanine amidase AmpD [Mariprofundaceae bacterium]|nr:1,6-anhydro-N-acetylmuramyl-L-alanine amidase AmpD [Mariprofundaceae bacterium]